MDEKDFVEKIVPEHDVVVVQYESFSGRVIILRPTDYDEGWGREIILEDSEWSITISYEDGSGVRSASTCRNPCMRRYAAPF